MSEPIMIQLRDEDGEVTEECAAIGSPRHSRHRRQIAAPVSGERKT